jgi:hypothetical protein
MRLTFLGKSSDNGDSPTPYATDQFSYIVLGWKVTDEEGPAKPVDPAPRRSCRW